MALRDFHSRQLATSIHAKADRWNVLNRMSKIN